jgi:hypothetical protein
MKVAFLGVTAEVNLMSLSFPRATFTHKRGSAIPYQARHTQKIEVNGPSPWARQVGQANCQKPVEPRPKDHWGQILEFAVDEASQDEFYYLGRKRADCHRHFGLRLSQKS